MRIDRGLRAAMATAYPAGYRAPIPASLNTEPARILPSPQNGIAPEDLKGPAFPESLALMVRLNPQRITEPIRIGLTINARRWPSLMLYDAQEDSTFSHRCVQLLYHGLGKVQWDNGGNACAFRGYTIGSLRLATVIDGGVLFEKTFLHQVAELLVHTETLSNGQTLVTPPGEQNSYPLWSYGGFFEPGCNIATIEQGVFTLTIDSHLNPPTYEVAASPLSFWKNKITARSGENIRFISNFRPKHWRNLAGDIESGQVRVDLCYGSDEHGETYRQIYRSCRFTQHDPNHGILEVFFTKEEN